MKFATYDIEASNWIHLVAIGFYDGIDYKVFYSAKNFINFLDKKIYNDYRVYAHFGGKYDINFLMNILVNDYDGIKIIESGSAIISCTVTLRNATITFADSYRLLPDKLEKIFDAWNIGYKKIAIDFDDEKSITKYNTELMARLESDTIGLWKVLFNFQNSEFCESKSMRLTIGSQALENYVNQFSDGEITVISGKQENSVRKNLYHGGRVECYKGKAVVNYYDVNSLYPFAMTFQMPMGKVNITNTSKFNKNTLGWYLVDIKSSPDFYIPPFLYKSDKRTFFVNGKGEYYISSILLEHLISTYGIRYEIKSAFLFETGEAIFKNYVNYFYKIKQENKGNSKGLVSKYMLNTLYGKLGQNRDKEIVTTINSRTHRLSKVWSSFSDEYGLVSCLTISNSKYILPHLAAWITERARFEHWKMIQEIGETSVAYIDTDSILTTDLAPTNLVSQSEMGKLKYEGTEQGYFLSPKSYSFGDVVKFKGFSDNEITPKDIYNAILGRKKISKKQRRLMTFRESINKRTKGIIDEENSFLKRIEFMKTVSGEYDRRIKKFSVKFLYDSEPYQRKALQCLSSENQMELF